MWQLCHCPSGFLRICNVAVRGAATLQTWRLRLRLWDFRHIVTSNGW
jgi:hypothetical protein